MHGPVNVKHTELLREFFVAYAEISLVTKRYFTLNTASTDFVTHKSCDDYLQFYSTERRRAFGRVALEDSRTIYHLPSSVVCERGEARL